MGYGKKYFELINDGLSNMIVTDKNGERIDVDAGLAEWAKRAYNLRQNTKGIIFFCGNGASATMAEHMSHDWFQNAEINTTTCSEVGHITAISNDLS